MACAKRSTWTEDSSLLAPRESEQLSALDTLVLVIVQRLDHLLRRLLWLFMALQPEEVGQLLLVERVIAIGVQLAEDTVNIGNLQTGQKLLRHSDNTKRIVCVRESSAMESGKRSCSM